MNHSTCLDEVNNMPEVDVVFYDQLNGRRVIGLPLRMEQDDIAVGTILHIHLFISGWNYYKINYIETGAPTVVYVRTPGDIEVLWHRIKQKICTIDVKN
jgi:hypothetical protein